MSLVCRDCGNKTEFRRVFDANVTQYIDPEGDRIPGTPEETTVHDDFHNDQCADCDSYALDDTDDEEGPSPTPST